MWRLPTYDHSAHVWKRREGVRKMRKRGEGDVSISIVGFSVFYDRGYIFVYIHVQSMFQELKQIPSSLSFSVTAAGQ